ncbi:MAG TPA: hypothetical protein VK249_34430 [Anaerolineales bacterium]|nr:hypothetical protein [Anaerolineales bacterium]
MTTKICPGCGEVRDAEADFTWSIKGIKRQSRCNVCRAIEQADYYERTKPDRLKYKWDRQVRKREEAREYVEAYKSTHPCVDCGKTDTRFLTFDHVRGEKKMNVSQMVNQGYSIEAIQAEINKCEVRCLECHHLRHH